MRRGKLGVVFIIFLIFSLSFSLVSASLFSNVLNRITGQAARSLFRTCEDTDEGDDPDVNGTVTYTFSFFGRKRTRTYVDKCYSRGRVLREYYCDKNNRTKKKIHRCKEGYCEEGRCKEAEFDLSLYKCYDEDNENYYEKSKVFLIKHNRRTNKYYISNLYEDFCRGDRLYEYICNFRNKSKRKIYRCENGCEDGACVKEKLDLNVGLIGKYEFESNLEDNVDNIQGDNYGVLFEQGVIGKAIRLDEGNFAIVKSSKFNFKDKDEISISVWIKSTNLVYSDDSIINNMGNGNGYSLSLLKGRVRFVIDQDWNNKDIESPESYIDWKWHHIVAVLENKNESSVMKIYVDGEKVSSKTFSFFKISRYADGIWIGKRGGGKYFKGQIDDLRIYDRALNGEEIKQLYESTEIETIQLRGEIYKSCSDKCQINHIVENKKALLEDKEEYYTNILNKSMNSDYEIFSDQDILNQINNAISETVILRPGKYYILKNIILKENIILKAEKLGDVVIISKGAKTIFSGYLRNASIKNLILIGDLVNAPYGMQFSKSQNVRIENNLFNNFTGALRFDGENENIEVKNNGFIGNGYHSVIYFTSRNRDGTCPDNIVKDSTIEGNFFLNNLQGVVLLCSKNIDVKGNYIKNSSYSGLRIETSSFNILSDNFITGSLLAGSILYHTSNNNHIYDNIIIDNNAANIEGREDCWDVQNTLESYYYQKERFEYTHSPALYQENGVYMFKNFFCQFQPLDFGIKIRSHNNIIESNIFGKYDYPERVTSPIIEIDYWKKYSNKNKNKIERNGVSYNNQFINNYFLDFDSKDILDNGCRNEFENNYKVNTSSEEILLYPNVDYDVILCTKDNFCNDNGKCEPEKGETLSMCPGECKCIEEGEKGSRQNFDVCCSGLSITETKFPTPEGCVNDFEGDFYCTNCGNLICEKGENSCSCPEDC